jgi:hypothetical protein
MGVLNRKSLQRPKQGVLYAEVYKKHKKADSNAAVAHTAAAFESVGFI